MAVTESDRLQTVGRGRDREGLVPAITGRDRDRQGSNPVSRPSAWDLFQLVSRGNTAENTWIVLTPLENRISSETKTIALWFSILNPCNPYLLRDAQDNFYLRDVRVKPYCINVTCSISYQSLQFNWGFLYGLLHMHTCGVHSDL